MPSVARTVPRRAHAAFHVAKQSALARRPRKPRLRRLSGHAKRVALAAAEKLTAKVPSANASPPGSSDSTAWAR